MCYIYHRQDLTTYSVVGDDLSNCQLVLFCDADFAGDRGDSRSTTETSLAIIGPNTYCPIACTSRRQGAVTLSACEAEVIAMVSGLKEEALPILDVWEALPSDRPLSSKIVILEDNHSTIRVAE